MIYVLNNDLENFKIELRNQEKKDKTIKQYAQYIEEFLNYTKVCQKEDITKQVLIDYKAHLKEEHKEKLNSINIKIIILNKFITFIGMGTDMKLKQEKQQKQTTLENVLSIKEYQHLRDYAKEHNQWQLYYLMGTLCGTGIRVSELQYITVEAVKKQEAIITNKGKARYIPIQNTVKKELIEYCKDNGINEGIIFKSKQGKPLDNSYIWRQLQNLARKS